MTSRQPVCITLHPLRHPPADPHPGGLNLAGPGMANHFFLRICSKVCNHLCNLSVRAMDAPVELRPISQPWLTGAIGNGRMDRAPSPAGRHDRRSSCDIVFTGLDRGSKEWGSSRTTSEVCLSWSWQCRGISVAWAMNGAPLEPPSTLSPRPHRARRHGSRPLVALNRGHRPPSRISTGGLPVASTAGRAW